MTTRATRRITWSRPAPTIFNTIITTTIATSTSTATTHNHHHHRRPPPPLRPQNKAPDLDLDKEEYTNPLGLTNDMEVTALCLPSPTDRDGHDDNA